MVGLACRIFCYFHLSSGGQETNSINELEQSHDFENALIL